MPETVVDTSEEESPAPEQTTPPEEDVATVKKRLAGKDQALTAAQQRAAQLERERDELARWKAEKEGADMTELERAVQRAAKAEADAAQARQEAEIARLAAKHPQGYKFYEDAMKLRDKPEEFMGYLEGLAKQSAAEPTEETPSLNLADRPRKTEPQAPTAPTKRSIAELEAEANRLYTEAVATG